MPDAEGWGLSQLTSGEIDITIERYAEDVKDIMDATGLEKAGIIAHSMGGVSDIETETESLRGKRHDY